MAKTPLLPDRYLQPDLFIPSLFDVSLKGDYGSVSYPIFTLKPGVPKNEKSRLYDRNGIKCEIFPSKFGYATIHDYDVLIYAISYCIRHHDRGNPLPNKIRFQAYDFLKATNRATGGNNYENLKKSLNRLAGTLLNTDIRYGGTQYWQAFHLLESAYIVREEGRILEIEIKLSDWTLDAIQHKKILTIHPNYFRLRKALERKLYTIALRHCGTKKIIKLGLDTLQEKSAARGPIWEFTETLKEIIESDEEHNHLPEYQYSIAERNGKEYAVIKNKSLLRT